MRYRFFSLLLLITILISCAKPEKPQISFTNITAQEVCKTIDKNENILLLDVRSEQEFNGTYGHLKNAILIPLHELQRKINEIAQYKNSEVIVYCRSGNRSITASNILIANGFKDVNNLLGGMKGWNSSDINSLPCKKELLVKNSS
ncbi:rhodanese-like domain-containing protein [candidate division KSB1 bacterium]